jgi:hypothetical protein
VSVRQSVVIDTVMAVTGTTKIVATATATVGIIAILKRPGTMIVHDVPFL